MGQPVIRNYHHDEFSAEVQNWDVVQSRDGLVYFANNAGVLEYDGHRWRLIELPSSLAVLSLAMDASGKGPIYVGGAGEFGYLGPDAAGRLRFNSLVPPTARRDGSFDQVFTPTVTQSGVYFQARSELCHWSADRLSCRAWSGPSRIFTAAGRDYVQQHDGALMEMRAGALQPVPGGERFAGQEITILLAWPGGERDGLLVGTRAFELVLRRNGLFRPFLTSESRRRARGELLDAAVLPDGSLALATSLSGLLIADQTGHVVRSIDRAAGLQDNHVHGVWADQQDGLWLALQNGISRVEAVSPFSRFGEESGLEREWREVTRHGDSIYVRGYKGLFAASFPSMRESSAPIAPPRPPRFTKIDEIAPPVWSFMTIDGRLLVSSKDGIHERRGGRFERVASYSSTPLIMYRSRSDRDRVYVGLVEGLASLRLVNGTWQDEGRLGGIAEIVTSIAEDDAGSLWLVSQRQRVMRVDLAAPAASDGDRAHARRRLARVHRFDRETFTGRTYVYDLSGRPVFLSETGIFEFEASSNRFVPVDELMAPLGADRKSFFWMTEDADGNLWLASRKPGAVDLLRKRPNGGYVLDRVGMFSFPVWSVYPDPQGRAVWLPTPGWLLRFDPSVRTRAPEASTLIRRVALNDGTTIPGAGYGVDPEASAAAGPLKVPFRDNSLRFDFAAPRFQDAERNHYQTWLEGFDTSWSGWSAESSRSYTNLPEGRYAFRVRARDARGTIGSDASFDFAVLPPWYRTRLAYAGYGAAFCGLLFALWRLHLKRAHLRLQRELERIELEKLREVDGLKSRVFADISHELRTPLTLILGPVEQLLEGTTQPEVAAKLHLIRRNADYLLRLISQLLDLAKLESGRMQLRAAPGDLLEIVNGIVLSFTSLADRQGIGLRCDAPADARIDTYVDPQVVEKVLNNLLFNACKFTPQGGTVSVTVSSSPRLRPGEALDEDFIEIAVADSGIGIPPPQLPRIFDRFYQGNGPRSREGIGIGLAVVKELVELHHGDIRVDSEEGRGTTFFVRLPKGQERFGEGEIAGEPLPATASASPRHPPLLAPGSLGHADARAAASSSSIESDDETTVLVVEDHDEMRRLLREQLEPQYRVIEAKEGAEALAAAIARLPDLVLSDVMMGPKDGFWLCHAIKTHEATCHVPIVLLTARATREDRLVGLSNGADCYMVKPFDTSELLAQVKNLIEQRRLLRHRFSGSVVLKPSEMAVRPMDEAFLQRVLTVVQANLENPAFDVERLGREVGLSRSQLHRKLRALTNQPPTLLIRSIRLYRAAELLKQKSGSVAEIAYAVGFSSQTYFAKCFREQFGCTPREYAQRADTPPPRLEQLLGVLPQGRLTV